jgi:hypothetical protein
VAENLPIVYVRGFAGSTSGIDAAVDDPFYGFNSGSTHVRVRQAGTPVMYQFEGPLLALLVDEGYQLLGTGTQGGQRAWLEQQTEGDVAANSVWVHRFYDVSASTWGREPQQFQVENAAKDLLDLVQQVRAKTGAPAVFLVAHSMGGLVCRSMLQKVVPDARAAGHLTETAEQIVDRFFTFATPHGGIEFDVGFGVLEWARDTFGIAGADIFGPTRMWRYLTPEADQRDHERAMGAAHGEGQPPRGWDPRSVPEEAFSSRRIFTLVGTNPGDYGVARGLSSAAVGVESDGLVQIANAVVPGARQAFVHRSHSGRYGIVNSEEGYQNLRRFLLGDFEVHAELVGFDPPVSGDDLLWQGEVELAVRGLPVLMHDRTAPHHCPLDLTPGGDAVTLGSTALLTNPALRPGHTDRVRYTLRLSVLTLRVVDGFFAFNDHVEKTSDFDDHLVVDLDLDTDPQRPQAWAAWSSAIGEPLRSFRNDGPPLVDTNDEVGLWVSTIPLPDPGRAVLGPEAGVRLTVHPRVGGST